MKRLFEAAGVDYVQWRALMRAYLQVDYSALLGAHGAAARFRAARQVLVEAVFFGLMGLAPAAVIWAATDTLFAATVMVTTTVLIVGMIVVAQTATIVAPDDHLIIGFRPISSRTYFVTRATAIVLHTLEATALSGTLPVGAFLIRDGVSSSLAAAAAVAVAASSLTVTLGLAALFGWLVSVTSVARLKEIVAYVQSIVVVALFGAYFATWWGYAGVQRSGLSLDVPTVLPRKAWILLYPGTWFASYVEIARGTAGTLEIVAAGCSVAMLAVLLVSIRGRLSVAYAMAVADSTIDATAPQVVPARSWGFLSEERRVVLLLTASHLRGDVNLQVALLTSVLMGAMFVAAGFYMARAGGPNVFMAQFVIFMLPTSVYQSLVTSAAFEASWPFFSTPADRVRLVIATRDVSAVCILMPLLVLMWGFYAYVSGDPPSALADVALLGASGYLALQLDVLWHPRLPFSGPLTQQQRRGWHAGLFMGAGMLAYIVVSTVGMSGRGRLAGSLIALLAVSVVLNRFTRSRVDAGAQRLDYLG